jgi:uncharacterized membrane protein
MSNAFSIKESLLFGWKTFKAHPWLFVKVSLVYLAVQFLLGVVQAIMPEMLAPAVGIVVGTLLGIGLITFYLKVHDAPTAATPKLLWAPEPFWRYLVTSLIMGALIVIGLLLLVVPGIILALAWGFALYIVIEKKVWTVEALKESARLTRGSRVKLLLFSFVLTLVNIVGMLLLLVGLFVSVPVTFLASIHVYRTLAGKKSESPVVSAEPAAA